MASDRQIAADTKKIIELGGNCYLDLVRETLVRDGLAIALSRTQFRLLYVLARNLGHPVTTRELIRYVWGYEELIDRNDLYVYICRIRQRLEDDPRKPQYLLSLRGMGYILFPIDKG
jgi:DNA-binding response OmpR family regulator